MKRSRFGRHPATGDSLKIARPFIRLPYEFDAGRLEQEVRQLPEGLWMPHPAGLRGNSAVPLISRDGGDNDDFHGCMRATPHLHGCLYLQQVMASFNEVIGRSRLMKLAPECEVSTHVDFNYYWYTRVRVHVPITTNPAVIFHCGPESLHMQPGESWIFDSWSRHRVENGGSQDRVHLVIDIAGSSRFWKNVRRMQHFDAGTDTEELRKSVSRIEYASQKSVQIDTENFNIAPVMAPGELDAMVHELIGDFGRHPGNDPGLVEKYCDLLMDLARDWRELWLRYGCRREAWAHHEALIARVREQLHPNPRALVTDSNEIGVNPIVVQRILNSLLAPDQLSRLS